MGKRKSTKKVSLNEACPSLQGEMTLLAILVLNAIREY